MLTLQHTFKNSDCALYPNGTAFFRLPTHSAAAGKAFLLTEEQLDAAVDFLDPNKDGSVSTYVFIAAWIPSGLLATEDGDPTLLLPVAENAIAETQCSLTVLT